MTRDSFAAGRAFLERDGRLLERRLAAVVFDGDDPAGVVDAVRAYRNADGGFGHGLEPDTRCPASLPIYLECALDALLAAGADGGDLVASATEWLATVADGPVPLAFPVIEQHPRAEHWSQWTYEPGLNPTAGLAGRLHALGVRHPWLDRATAWTWEQLDQGFGTDAHTLAEVLVFLAHVPDRARVDAAEVGLWVGRATLFHLDPAAEGYGLTPLHFARTPDSLWRRLFDDTTIDGHLDRLAADQQADGGWPITWESPSMASTVEWRGIETLRALMTLRAYGRMAG